MKEKENWKDYLMPGCMAAGLIALMISVAVFGRQDFERESDLSFTSEDVSVGFIITTADEGFDRTIVPTTTSNLLKKPENMDVPLAFDKWNDNLFFNSFRSRISGTKTEDVPKLLEEISEIRESDGAIYYYALGYIFDRMMRSSTAENARDTQYAKAMENYDKAIAWNDQIAFFHHFRGQADYFYAEKTGRPEYYTTAIPFYLKAEQLAPNWVRPLGLQGWCAFHLGKFRESLALFERATKIDPYDSDVQNGLSRVRAALAQAGIAGDLIKKPENMDDALAFEKWKDRFHSSLISHVRKLSIDEVPQFLEDITEIRENDGAIYYFVLGYVYDMMLRLSSTVDSREDFYVKAAENYDKARELNGKIAHFHHFRGLAEYYFALRTQTPDSFTAAIPYYLTAEQLAPNWVYPVSLQGWCAFHLGKYREALLLFGRAAEIDSDNKDVQDGLKQTHIKLERAADFLDDELPLDFTGKIAMRRIKKPETTDSRELDRWNEAFRDIVVSAGFHRPDEVAELVTQWTGLTEEDGKFYHYVCGYVHDRMSRIWKEFRLSHYAKAVERFTKAIELDADVAVFYHFRGQVNYFFAENENLPEYYEKAMENYILAERCDPAWPMPVDMQGWVLMRQEKYDEAVTCFERAVAIDDDCFDAMSGMVQVIDKKMERDPKNIELIKQGLDWIERWHRIIVKRSNDQELPNGTALARKLITRWKNQEKISPVEYPKCFTRDELANRASALTLSEPEETAFLYDQILNGEVSPYFYYEFKNPPERKFLTQYQEKNAYFNRAFAYFKIGDYEKALAASDDFRKISDDINWSPSYAEAPNIHFIHVKSLFGLKRYEEVIDYYASGKVTLDQLKQWGNSHHPLYADIALAMSKAGQTEQMLDFVAHFEKPNRDILGLITSQSRVTKEPLLKSFVHAYAEALYQKALYEDADHSQNLPQSTVKRLNDLLNLIKRYDDGLHPYYKKLGDMFFERKQYASAAVNYEQYLKYASHETDILEPLLQCYETLRNGKEAVCTATILIMLHPDNPDLWIRRARIHHKYPEREYQNRESLSINDMNRAIELLERNGETDKKRLAQAYVWRGEMLCNHQRFHHATADYMKAVELVAGTPLNEVLFENTGGDKTVFAYQLLLCNLLNYWNYPHPIEKPIAELCTEFIKQGGDELFLVAARAEFWKNAPLKAIDDYLVVMEFSKADRYGDVKDIGYEGFSKISKEHACKQLASCYYSLSTGNPNNKEYFDKAIGYCTQMIEKYPRNNNEDELPYSWCLMVYRAQVEKNDLLTDEERERYKKLQGENENKIQEIRNRTGNE